MLIEGPIPSRRDRGDERDVLVPVLGRLPESPLALRRPRPQRHEPDVGRALVHEDEAAEGLRCQNASSKRLCACSSRSVAPSVFFFERPAQLLADRPAHRGQRHPHASGAPPTARSGASRVASSFSSSCFHSARFSSAVREDAPFAPRGALRFEVLALAAASHPALDRSKRETPKSSETSSRGSPRSTAPSTRTLRSFEYAFMA